MVLTVVIARAGLRIHAFAPEGFFGCPFRVRGLDSVSVLDLGLALDLSSCPLLCPLESAYLSLYNAVRRDNEDFRGEKSR